SDVHIGSIPRSGSGWVLDPIVDAAHGQIAVVLYSTTAIHSSNPGSLVTIDLHSKSGAAAGTSALNLVPQVELPDGRVFQTMLTDELNSFVLEPAPTVADDDATDGLVTIVDVPATIQVAAVAPAPVAAASPTVTA